MLSDQRVIMFESDDYAPTPTDKYAKTNLDLPKGVSLLAMYQTTIQKIAKSFPTFHDEEPQAEEETPFEQLSIFDEPIDE